MKRYYGVCDWRLKDLDMSIYSFNSYEEAEKKAEDIWHHLAKKERVNRELSICICEVDEDGYESIIETLKEYK